MTISARPTLDGWRARLVALEQACPWPGPRPLTGKDHDLLCGRDAYCTTFRQEVDEHRLVFLAGLSGVGKSSLLMAGLIPGLKDSDYHVATCRDWSGTAGGDADPADFLARQVAHELDPPIADLPSGPTLFAELNRRHGKQVVLVLDQFEELIRNSPDFKDKLFDLLIYLNHRSSLKVVISLRSEYLHELRPLERQAKPFSVSTCYLDDIETEYGHEVALAANRKVPGIIDEDAARAVEDVWGAARRAPVGAYGSRTGVLQLQAFLYSLHARSSMLAGTASAPVRTTLVAEYVDGITAQAGTERTVFEQAMQDSVNIKLDRCAAAAAEVGVDEYLLHGTSDLLARSVRHLSSAGYKLVRDALDLAHATIGAELASLVRGMGRSRGARDAQPDGPATHKQVDTLFQTLISTILEDAHRGAERAGDAPDLFADREELARVSDARCEAPIPWSMRLHAGASPLEADPAEVTSGPMLGMAPAAVLMEEFRRFAFTLAWLRETALVRLTIPGTDNAMASLIHDGFGSALEQWSRERADATAGPLHGLTAPNGADFEWPSPEGEVALPEFDGGDPFVAGSQAKHLANLRWRGARIKADLRNVIFVNCDLRGSWFDRCRFEGVGFVNCLLDGVMFSDCTISGAPQPPPGAEWDTDAPEFRIATSAEIARAFERYRRAPEGAEWLLAQTPELPAVPASGERRLRVVPSLHGGVVIYGGRISALVVRGGEMIGGGTFSIRDSAGSGFDVVELSSAGRYEIVGSVIRHLSFNTSPTAANSEMIPLEIVASGSALFQVWIGQDLQGSFTAADCTLLDVWNGSEDLVAELVLVPVVGGGGAIGPSTFHGLVGVAPVGEHRPLTPDEKVRTLAEVDPTMTLRARATAMDYRRHPSLPQVRTLEPREGNPS